MTRPERAVVKLGGSSFGGAIEDVAAFAARCPRLCVVHGGGPQITALMRERGVEPQFVGGRRVTDVETLSCAVQGLRAVSAKLCADLEAVGLRPAPLLSGVLLGERVPELGFVGRPTDATTAAVLAAWDAGQVPVIAPLAASRVGLEPLLNVNADDAAACLAGALAADELVFLSDVPGVLDETGALIPSIDASAPPAVATGGMLPKLEACSAAVRAGVGRVSIGVGGTRVTA